MRRTERKIIVGSIMPAFPPSVSLVLCEGNSDDSVPKSGFLWQRVSPPPPCCRTNALFPAEAAEATAAHPQRAGSESPSR